ncbi:MAG: DUF2809 domain-containing protein [Candidatus Latescibacteria bacterium]|nr:DUF2809 domain-containing protein [Candidatus Latescibacterota bacterium]
MIPLQKPRRAILRSLFVVTPLGFATKFYPGPGAWWFNNYAGGLLYEVFWCLAAGLMWPRASAFRIAARVLGITCALEFLQLWHPPFLEGIRATFIGRTLIGTSFTWWDFPYYILGWGAGWIWVGWLQERSQRT